ncbi:hypothetical protein AMTR_s00058p00155870 [Amborella trichopoda]|uniref:Uncharacterized protein n=1 Tax=Amborella trichopoda TaxID=13333 RepID=W1PF55_AMBTC|nr:hypothetical protein AMTR_s00058p00155870 [Amborella trichopoda]
MIEDCPLTDLAVKVAAVRDCATALRAVSYDKGLFDQLKGLLSKLELWGIEASQRESEVLIRGYEEEKSICLSNQARLRKEDALYYAKIVALEEERARLDANIHKLKTQQEQKRREQMFRASLRNWRLWTLRWLSYTMLSQVPQAISLLKEQIKKALELSEALKIKIQDVLEKF